jgi:antitoxin HigA-1
MATPIHPGEILADELAEIGMSPTAFAREIAVPPNRISQIIAGRRAITGDTALRLGRWFGMNPQFWMNLQSLHDLETVPAMVRQSIEALPTRSIAA